MADEKTLPQIDGARLDFSGAMSYGDYLCLDQVLAAQKPRSRDHNEMLFIVQHQASELWMKLAIHELKAARDRVRADDLQPAFKMLARVSRIMAQLNQSWDVLSTLTPAEYSSFRDERSHRRFIGAERVGAAVERGGDDGHRPAPYRRLRTGQAEMATGAQPYRGRGFTPLRARGR